MYDDEDEQPKAVRMNWADWLHVALIVPAGVAQAFADAAEQALIVTKYHSRMLDEKNRFKSDAGVAIERLSRGE